MPGTFWIGGALLEDGRIGHSEPALWSVTMKRSEPREDDDNSKGTDKPWERPGQTSQNPDQKAPTKPDLEKWHKTNTH